jgi:hypothetical protein
MTKSRSGCASCERTPLVGERMHVFGRDGDERWLCELCVGTERARSASEPLRVERVRASERPLRLRSAA